MISKPVRMLVLVIVLAMFVAACQPAGQAATQAPAATVDVNPIYTAAAKTIEVENTRKAALIPTATETPLPTDAPTEEPTATIQAILIDGTAGPAPTLWIPATGKAYPTIRATINTNCRKGPDPKFEIMGGLNTDQTSEVHGKYIDGGWWYIRNPSNPAEFCWVWNGSTIVEGDISEVPFVVPPPVPPVTDINVSLAVVPVTSSTCPQTFVFTATVYVDAATIINYSWIRNGEVVMTGTKEFDDDGTYSITYSPKYKETFTDHTMQFRVTNVLGAKSSLVSFSLDCP
jgi:hypothetical protein